MANLEQSGNQMLGVQCVKLTFLLIATFYLTKTENRTKKSLTKTENNSKKSLTPLSHYCFEYCPIFAKKCRFFTKKVMTSAKLRRSWQKKVFFQNLQRCVLTYQMSSFQHNSNEFRLFHPLPPSPSHLKINPPKEPTSIRVKQPTSSKLKLKSC